MQKKSRGSQQYNLTEGGILHKLLVIALPVVGSQIIQMTYNLTDMFWLGRLPDSSQAVAASGSVGMYLWLSMAFLILGARGAEIGVSQNTGKGDLEKAREIGQSSVVLSAMIGLIIFLLYTTLSVPLVGFFNIRDAVVVGSAQVYLRIVSIGIPFIFTSAAVTGIFNGSGNSRTPFFINMISLGINMVLDPILILWCKMGVTGAAIATIIAQIIACVLLIAMLLKGKSRPFERFKLLKLPDKENVRTIFGWTLPIAIESFLFTFLTMFISRFIAVWGTNAMAAQRIGSQVESLSWLVAGGFSMALTSFVGQNYGARKWNRIRRGVKISTIAMVVYGFGVMALMYFGAQAIYRIFIGDNQNVIEIGVSFMKILAMCEMLGCLEGVAAGAFRGMGKTLPPSIVSAVTNAGRVALAYFLQKTPLGLDGIWIGVTVGAAIRGLWMFIWYMMYQRKLPKEDEVTEPTEAQK